MICRRYHLKLTGLQTVGIYRDYLEFVGEPHMRTCSVRDNEYGAVVAMADFQPSDIVLDIGCATSYLILYVSQFVEKAYGIDDIYNGGFLRFTVQWLETLKDFEDYRTGKTEVIDQNASQLPFPDAYFDTIFTVSALEHFRDDEDTACVKEVARVLKPGGNFLGTVDFNPLTEAPKEAVRAYTYKTFLDRIVLPSGLALKGKDFVKDDPVPSAVDFIVVPLFFHLVKGEKNGRGNRLSSSGFDTGPAG